MAAVQWHRLFIPCFNMAIAMKSNPTKTVLTITVGFLIVYMVTQEKWAINVSVVIGLSGIFSTFIAQKIEWLWMKLAWILSLVVPNILLSLVFFIFLFPIALLSRLTSKKNLLQRKQPKGTVFKTRNVVFNAKSLENPW